MIPRAVHGQVFHFGPDGSEDGDDRGGMLASSRLPLDDLVALGQGLESADVLTPGYIPPPMGCAI